MSKLRFKLNAAVRLPGQSDHSGVIAEIKQTIFSEPSYLVLPYTGLYGAPPAQWHWESHLVEANPPAPAAPSPVMHKLRTRRKAKR